MNVLAIGAHFDDIELGCGGAIARHVQKGDYVTMYVATRSGYQNPKGEVIRSDEVALKEGRAAAKILGVKQLICGEDKTLEVRHEDALFCKLLKVIEKNKIDTIYTHWMGDTHPDHQILARATLHVARHIPRVLMYQSNWYTSNEVFRGGFFIDISDFWAKKEQAIVCHESEIKRNKGIWLDYFKNDARNNGYKVDVELAECFEVVRWMD